MQMTSASAGGFERCFFFGGSSPAAAAGATAAASWGLRASYVRSVATLERLLPDWFTGASELLANSTPAKQTHTKNNVTGTYKMGCISKGAENLLLANDVNRAEMDLYDNAEALFWKQYYDHQAFKQLRMKSFDLDVDDSYDGNDSSFI